MARELTDKQKLFLEVLFSPEANGNAAKAKLMAGYEASTPTSYITRTLKDEILEATRDFLVANGPKAALSMADVLNNPTQLGVRDKIAAAKDVLDRIGVVKVDKIEVGGNGIFILPAKKDE